MGSSWKRQGVEEPSYHDDRSMGEHAFLAFTQSERNSLSKLDKFCQSTRLLLRFLRKQVVGEAHGEFAAAVQFVDDCVIARVVLEAATSVNRTRHAEAIEFAHKEACRVQLVFSRKFRPLRQGRIKNHRVRAGDEQSRGVAS